MATDSANILFGGDVALAGAYESLSKSAGGGIFNDLIDLIKISDFTMANLETPVCESSNAIIKSGPTIRALPESLVSLSEAGFGGVCLANNHIFDHGREGLSQTLAALDKYGIRYSGAGLDRSSAEAPVRLHLAGRQVSIFSFAEREFNVSEDGEAGAALLEPLRMAPLLLQERRTADAVLVCVHGGNEYFPFPRPGFRKLCQFLVDMGADAVIGHHPHVPGPYEIYRGKPIVYSLGNLIFDHKQPPKEWCEGYLARIKLRFSCAGDVGVNLEIVPYRQSAAEGGLHLLSGDEKAEFITRIEDRRAILERHERWMAEWHQFVRRRQWQAMIDLFSPVRFRGMRRISKLPLFRNMIMPSSRKLLRLNMLQCDSHREVVLAALSGMDNAGRADPSIKEPHAGHSHR
ncbi:CapA family protein [Pacificimonas flava]|uniref:CapA family protein n=1 Tax=Pacificimonas flava TaxID=1234595 RepID=UPI0004BCA130|nr:CapA family protein [Pacificimonas flava]MBB5281782.1 poly-gamma-glutamate synthesis protein (capsule biosynthesis protein) [Pacificimonas flava]